jgi:hypothetical protein
VNQCLNASQVRHQLEPDGYGLDCGAYLLRWGTPGSVCVAGREATVKGYGVAVAMPQGQSWAPHLSSGSVVNVGTIPVVPSPVSRLLAGGKARRRLRLPGWGGGAVVVRAQESCAHGEGPQRVRSNGVTDGVRW